MRFKLLLSTCALVGTLAATALPAVADGPAIGSGTAVYPAPASSLVVEGEPGAHVAPRGAYLFGDYAVGDVVNTFDVNASSGSLTAFAEERRPNAWPVQWHLRMSMPGNAAWSPGTYTATRFGSTTEAALDFSGEGRGCNRVIGSVTVGNVERAASGAIRSLAANFSLRCEQDYFPLVTGRLRFNARNFVSYTSEAGDPIGLGLSATVDEYRLASSRFDSIVDGRDLFVSAAGGGQSVQFRITPPREEVFVAGRSYATAGGARNNLAAMKLAVNGRTCGRPNGVLTIRSLSESNGVLGRLVADYELTCEGAAGSIHGRVEYIAPR